MMNKRGLRIMFKKMINKFIEIKKTAEASDVEISLRKKDVIKGERKPFSIDVDFFNIDDDNIKYNTLIKKLKNLNEIEIINLIEQNKLYIYGNHIVLLAMEMEFEYNNKNLKELIIKKIDTF